MMCPVVCFSCGLPIEVEDLFKHLRADRVKTILSERNTTATQATSDAGLQIDCSDILDKLKINYDCCRKTIISAMDFTDYYY